MSSYCYKLILSTGGDLGTSDCNRLTLSYLAWSQSGSPPLTNRTVTVLNVPCGCGYGLGVRCRCRCHLLAPQPPVCVLCVMLMAFDVRTPSQVQLVKRSECQARYSSYNNDSRSSTRILGVCACARVCAVNMSCRSIDYTCYK